jgi:hypothetical protein
VRPTKCWFGSKVILLVGAKRDVRVSKLAPTLFVQMKPTHAKTDFVLKSKIDTPGWRAFFEALHFIYGESSV